MTLFGGSSSWWLTVVSLTLAATSVAAAPRLPYDPQQIRVAQAVASAPPVPCPALVPPPRELSHGSRYRPGDGTASTVDPERLAAAERAVKPVRDFNRLLWNLADRSLREPQSAAFYADCVLGHLDHWASGGAVTGSNSFAGNAERKWNSIAAALAYLDVRAYADEARSQRIEAWLARTGHDVKRRYGVPIPAAVFSSLNNNHAYWAALSAVSTGAAASDRALFHWGMSRFLRALDDIDEHGLLRHELRRGSLALQYHRFSLGPLLLLRLFALHNEVAVTASRDAALRRLADRVLHGGLDPSMFEQLTGKEQTGPLPPAGHQYAWGELALALWPDTSLEARIAPYRPFRHVWLGGDLTLRYRNAN